MTYLRTTRTSFLFTAFGLAWQLGAIAGLAFWGYRYDYQAAALSVVVPLYGPITIAGDLLR